MKKIIRLTESDLHRIIERSVQRIIKEDVLGNDWNVNDEDNEYPYNNYEPFESQKQDDEEHEMGIQGEANLDPTVYESVDEEDRHRKGYYKDYAARTGKKDRHRKGYYKDYNKKHPERLERVGIRTHHGYTSDDDDYNDGGCVDDDLDDFGAEFDNL